MANTKKKGLRQWLIRILTPKNENTITDEMRELALATRRQEHFLKQKEKQLEMMERIMNIDVKMNPKEDAIETLVKQCIPLLLQKLGEQSTLSFPQPGQIMQPPQANSNPGEVCYTDEQVTKIVNENPKLKKYAQKFSDEEIKDYLINQVPQISKQSIQKIIQKVRT